MNVLRGTSRAEHQLSSNTTDRYAVQTDVWPASARHLNYDSGHRPWRTGDPMRPFKGHPVLGPVDHIFTEPRQLRLLEPRRYGVRAMDENNRRDVQHEKEVAERRWGKGSHLAEYKQIILDHW